MNDITAEPRLYLARGGTTGAVQFKQLASGVYSGVFGGLSTPLSSQTTMKLI